MPKKSVSASKLDDIMGEFYNELLNQTIRLEIYSRTKSIRELIFARALHSASIQINESPVLLDAEGANSGLNKEDDPSQIAQNWFDAFPVEDKNDCNA